MSSHTKTTWQECFATHSQPHWDSLLRFGKSQGLNPERSRDALQNALLRGLKYFSNYCLRHLNISTPEEASLKISNNPEAARRFRGWLFQVMRNSIYDNLSALRKQEIHLDESTWNSYCDETKNVESETLHAEEISPENLNEAELEKQAEELFARAADDILHKALAQLSSRHRQILFLIAEDHSYAEVASILGIPIGSVMSGLSRALQKIRTSLEKRDGE